MAAAFANIICAAIVATAMILTDAPTYAWLGLALAVYFIMNATDYNGR